MRQIILIAHNLRSCYNVGSLLRTTEGLGVERVYLTGYTPYPLAKHDERLPHLARKIANQINKSALGAETMIDWQHSDDIRPVLRNLKNEGYEIVALEQSKQSVALNKFKPEPKLVIIVGREVEGVESEILDVCDTIVEIPMAGKKESFNVASAAAMALYNFIYL